MAAGQGLRGLVGQQMSGRKAAPRGQVYKIVDVTAAGSGTILVPETGWMHLLAWGGGGGGSNDGSSPGGGAGGGGFRRQMHVTAGQTFGYTVGSAGLGNTVGGPGGAGGDTTVTFPDGLAGVAFGGAGGINSAAVAGGGYRLNGNMTGSTGGSGGFPPTAAAAGADSGGAAGANAGSYGAGGGQAGFASYLVGLGYGAGGNGSGADGGVGAGGGGNNPSAGKNGGAGRLLALFVRD